MEHSVLTRCHGHNGQGWGQCQVSQGPETWEQSHHQKKINWSMLFHRPFGPMCIVMSSSSHADTDFVLAGGI